MDVTFIDVDSQITLGCNHNWDEHQGYGVQRGDVIETVVYEDWRCNSPGMRHVFAIKGKKFVDSQRGCQPYLYLYVHVLNDEPFATR